MQSRGVQPRSKKPSESRSNQSGFRLRPLKKQRVDAATLASTLQLKEQSRELFYSFLALAMKLGFLSLGVVSVLKLGLASHQRVLRHAEISSVLVVESAKLGHLQQRFDYLFTIGGNRRLMDEQDQWIAPNRVRIMWR